MKCKTCGKGTTSLAAMAKHYRKDHPSKMKRTTKARSSPSQYCSKCGEPI